ncbi:MAG: SMP-30/gluconolactonase/LRE family protein [Pirellulaceae bacterium]
MNTTCWRWVGRTSLLMTTWLAVGTASDAAEFDVVIRNGRVVDGTGNPWYLADVAVRGDRIAAIGTIPAGAGKREIDASGRIVAPGFIDMHSHSDWLLLEDGRAESKIRQGVTTEVLGEGDSAGPNQGRQGGRTVQVRGRATPVVRLRDYFQALDDSGIAVNVASYVGLNNLWRAVMGQSFERPTAQQLAQMKQFLSEAMADGARGLSSQLMMPPGSLATTDELVELCRDVVRPAGGIFSCHIRNEGTGVFESVREVIEIGERAGVPVDNIHLKIADQQYWGRMNEIVAMIAEARRRGVDIQANVYPYTRGNNNLSSIIPPWAHEGGTARMLERLKDPGDREKIKRDIRQGVPGWYNHYTAVGGDWSRMLISASNPLAGLTMDRVLALRSANRDPQPEPLDVLLDLLLEHDGSISTVYAHHTEDDMVLALSQPWCSIGSDGSAYAVEGNLRRGHPHPRNFGTFPRVLGVYVRERGILSLEDAIRKMTSLNANRIGLTDRGVLRPGLFADITVFDPGQVVDHSTYTEPFQYSEGITWVLVNGQVVLDQGQHTGALPGRALRKAPAVPAAGQSVLAPGSRPQQLLERGAGEGPAWHPDLGLLTSGDGHIMRRTHHGEASIFLADAGSNGLLFDSRGRLVICEPVRRRVSRRELDGSLTVLADNYQGKRFNQPNDVTIDSQGRIYFSDPRYGDRAGMELVDDQGQTVEGVYRIDPDGQVSRIIAHEVDRPNGLLVTPDDRYLYVADNNNDTVGGARKLWRFDLRPNGTVDAASRRLIHDWKETRGPDGIKIDSQGRLFVAAGLNRPNPPFEVQSQPTAGIYVFAPAGDLLEFIPIPRDECTNCAFGGDDLQTLFVTAGGTLWSFRVREPGRVLYETTRQ